MHAWLSAMVAAVLLTGCKDRPSYDRSTPEKTLESFFTALDKGRIPEHLERFVADPQELRLWRLRCESHGCTGGEHDVVEVSEVSGYRATLLVDYSVVGQHGGVIMRGRRSPLQLEREGDDWLLVQFGRRIQAGRTGAGDAGPSPETSGTDDAGAPDDAGADDAAASE